MPTSMQQKALIAELNTMTLLQSIATRFVQEADLSAVLLEIIDAAVSITNADKGNIQLVDQTTGALKIVASRGFSQPFLDHFAICLMGKGACATSFQKGERITVGNIMESPLFVGTPNLKPLLMENIRAVQSTPLRNRSGNIIGMLSTHYCNPYKPKAQDLQMLDLLARLSTDIVERGQLIEERAKLVEKLREVDRRKNNFLAMLSHELRNPLASLSNSFFILSNAATGNDDVNRAKSIIDRQLKQIIRHVDDLLDITSITQNKIQLHLRQFDLNELVSRVIEDNCNIFESLGNKLQSKFADMPIMVRADPVRITQVVSNLLHNASKFSIVGGITQIFISLDKKNCQAVIRIIDNGIGIEPNLLNHLFEPFMQADSSIDRGKGGLGLGLTLVKGIIEMHGGNVGVSSKGPNQGAEFIVRLPLDNTIQNVKTIKKIKNKKFRSRCILIIDDNIDVATSLRQVLEIFGHVVHASPNGIDGIKMAYHVKPYVVLCDIGLPGMDGYQVAKSFKEDKLLSSIYLIALSGYAQPEDIKRSRDAGFDKHLAKPVNLAVLEQLLLEI